jgi:hypothetical protein
MTKFLHWLSGLLIWVLFAALGVALIHANIPGVTQTAFDFIPLRSLEAAASGGILILLCILYVVTFAPRRPKVRYLSFEYIRKLSGEFGAVISIDPKILAEKDSLRIDLNVNLVAGARIPELSQALQSRVRESLRDGLGIEEISEIKVRVQEITGEPRSTRRD